MATTTALAPAAAQPPAAGPSRQPSNNSQETWSPKRYLEPNHPDNEEVLEQAAYQAAVTRPPGDSRGNRKYKPRRTVDYMGGVQKLRIVSLGCDTDGESTIPDRLDGQDARRAVPAANTPQPQRHHQRECRGRLHGI